jgi:hypothetical protein
MSSFHPSQHDPCALSLSTSTLVRLILTVIRLRHRITKGPASSAAGVAMASKLIARFEKGKLVGRPTNQEVLSKSRDMPIHRS